MLRPPNDPQNISAVKAESEPLQRAYRSCRLETKMLLVLCHDANGQLASGNTTVHGNVLFQCFDCTHPPMHRVGPLHSAVYFKWKA